MASLGADFNAASSNSDPDGADQEAKEILLQDAQEPLKAVDANSDLLEKETRCGIGFLRFPWMQKLASKKAYVFFYGLSGSVHFALSAYFVATISTIEKRFQIPSKFSGLINSSWDFGSVFTILIVSYLGRSGHKPRWVACGTALVGLSCYMRLIPHWLYGPGENALLLTREFGTEFRPLNLSDTSGPKMTLCGNNHTDFEDCTNASSGNISAYIFLAAHVVLGIGSAVYYCLGISYLDDNAKKNKAPVLIALCQCLRMLGPTVGYMLASYALEIYVDPLLTPVITSKDPRWIGAWWLGWGPLGTACLCFSVVLSTFPRSLPRAAQRSVAAAAALGRTYNPQETDKKSFADFKATLGRMIKNKVLMCNNLSSICFTFGLIGQWTFMPKYMETQFNQSASTAALISGSVGLLCTAAGLMVSAVIISKFKPNARRLAGWNVFVEFLDCFGFLLLTFIGCETFKLQGTPQTDGTLGLGVDCNADCSCPDSVRYSPVCHPPSGTTFFSPCHAGCADVSWGEGNSTSKLFSNCNCVNGGGPVIDGPCAVDCSQAFMLFIIVQCVQRFLGATGKAGNTLIHFRCVAPEDKSVAIGFSEFLMCGCAFIPGPIVFGYLIDMACLVWGQTCGSTGNCWLYNVEALRYLVNLPIVGCLFLGTLWDIGVWYYAKGLQLYDDDDLLKKQDKISTAGET